VKRPVEVIVPLPFVTAHVTAVLLVPDTVAANCCCHFAGMVVEVGEIEIEILGTVTPTEADPAFVGSATLTACTV
jgi:hypothetical protein